MFFMLSITFRILGYLDSVFCMRQIHIKSFTPPEYGVLLMQIKGEP